MHDKVVSHAHSTAPIPHSDPYALSCYTELERAGPDTSRETQFDMNVTSKCYYALRAIYALADSDDPRPMKINEIAERELIPVRFLETIMNELKRSGFVQSWRGAEGGYRLARPAEKIMIGEILRLIDGPIAPVDCVSQTRPKECDFHGACTFFGFWGRVRRAISEIVDSTSFADLISENKARPQSEAQDWTI